MTNSLDLAGEEASDALHALEAAFGLSAEDWPEEDIETVGELEAFLWSHLAEGGDRDGQAGMTTMTFLRLRAVIDAPGRLSPASPLAPLAGAHPRRFFRDLAAATGLDLPPLAVSRRGALAALLFFLGAPLGVAINGQTHSLAWLIVALASWPLMIAVLWTDPNRVPAGLTTLGDLARQTVPLNHRKLAEGGGFGRDGLWEAMIAILSGASDTTIPEAAIARDTRLFATLH